MFAPVPRIKCDSRQICSVGRLPPLSNRNHTFPLTFMLRLPITVVPRTMIHRLIRPFTLMLDEANEIYNFNNAYNDLLVTMVGGYRRLGGKD